jgi:hypothetical protein
MRSDSASFATEDARIIRLFSALKEPLLLRRQHALFEALRDLTATDLPRLVAHAQSLSGKMAVELLDALLEHWFQVDPRPQRNGCETIRITPAVARGCEPIRKAPSAKRWAHLWHCADWGSVLERWMRSTATIIAPRLRESSLFQEEGCATGVSPRLSPTGPLMILLRHTSSLPRFRQVKGGTMRVSGCSPLGPIATRRCALHQLTAILPDLDAIVSGNQLVTRVAERVAAKDLPLVLDWLGRIPEEFRGPTAIATASHWAKRDPVAALEWCLAHGVEVGRGQQDQSGNRDPGVLGSAMSIDPAKTVDWLEALPPVTSASACSSERRQRALSIPTRRSALRMRP